MSGAAVGAVEQVGQVPGEIGPPERLLGQFASLGAVAPRLAPARALASLRSLAAETLFQPEGGSAPIQILGVLEGTGLAFDALWVAGLTADRWPAALKPNPLLPLAWQRQRNVPRATARREREYAEDLTARFARARCMLAEPVLRLSTGARSARFAHLAHRAVGSRRENR